MNILDFNKWSGAVNEGIDTNISSDDNDSKDEITIDDTTYTIRKNKISTNNVEISDNKLKTDIKNAMTILKSNIFLLALVRKER